MRSSCGIVAGVGAALAIAACGGSSSPHRTAEATRGSFPVAVTTARFPGSQRLAEPTRLVIAVRNAGHRAVPDVAVTICNGSCAADAPRGEGTDAAAFGADVQGTDLANSSRPLWIVNRQPGPCGYSCRNGGAGAGVSANSNTWALGRLAPGRTARFQWRLTAVAAGRHVVAWQVAGDLTGGARAVLPGGGTPHGTFTVRVRTAPAASRVTSSGRVVTTGGQ